MVTNCRTGTGAKPGDKVARGPEVIRVIVQGPEVMKAGDV
jgi:hypothetical protein